MTNGKMRVVLSPIFQVSVVSLWTITMGFIVVPLVQGFVSTATRPISMRQQQRQNIGMPSSSYLTATTIADIEKGSSAVARTVDPDVIGADNPLHICIAGAGVGGLALANGLLMGNSEKDAKQSHRNVKVTIVEQTPEFKRFGGPIQLASNALQIVKEMDLELYDAVMEKFTFTGDKTNGIVDGIRTEWYSKFDLRSPAESRDMPYSGVIDRPDLQDLYLGRVLAHRTAGGAAAADDADRVTLHQGNGLVSYEQLADGRVNVSLENGDTLTADVLIGADGIWSKVRAKMYGQPSARGEGSGAVYSGYTVYAGELSYAAPDNGRVGYKVYIGPSQYFVITDIGKGKYQWYAFLARPPNSKLPTTSSTSTDESSESSTTSMRLQDTFRNWSGEIHDILKATKEDEIEQRDLYDRKPSLRPWYDGHVALLGDGIHAMPNLGQGGCQAMEDAYVLNQELQRITHKSQIPSALARYQDRRFVRASAVQGLSRFASDIIIRGFDTPAKMTWNETTGALQFENCNYAGLVTRLLQPFLPIFFAVQFNFLYDGYRNEKKIDVPATIGFTLLGGLIASLLSLELVEAGLAARWGLGALVGTETAVIESTTSSSATEGIQQFSLPNLDAVTDALTQFLDKLF